MSRIGADGAGDGDCVRVDTTVLDEAVQRVGRAGEDAAAAGRGLAGLTVSGVAVGGQAVHDALGDLVRLWARRLDGTEAAARGLASSLRQARWEYAATEIAALVAAEEPSGIRLLPGVEEWLADRTPPDPVAGAPPPDADPVGPR